MCFTTLFLKTFLVHQWGQNSESFVDQKNFLGYLKVCHRFMAASGFFKAGKPSKRLGFKKITYKRAFLFG